MQACHEGAAIQTVAAAAVACPVPASVVAAVAADSVAGGRTGWHAVLDACPVHPLLHARLSEAASSPAG